MNDPRPVPGADTDGSVVNVTEPSQAQLDNDIAQNPDTGEGEGANESQVDQAG